MITINLIVRKLQLYNWDDTEGESDNTLINIKKQNKKLNKILRILE